MAELHEDTIIGFPLFAGYTAYGVRSMLDRGEVREIPAGQILLREGDPSTEVFLVLRGRLAALVERNGKTLELSEQGPGMILGELGVLCGIPRSASVCAVEDSLVLQWNSQAFRSMLLSDPALSERIFRQSLRMLIDHSKSLIDQLTHSPPRI